MVGQPEQILMQEEAYEWYEHESQRIKRNIIIRAREVFKVYDTEQDGVPHRLKFVPLHL